MEYFYKCPIKTFDSRYKNDVYHPCVRFIEKGFGGHQWWMVQSPFYKSDDSIENPLLFFSDSILYNGRIVPKEWILFDVVKDTPEGGGYNSDPYLYIENDRLIVLWREFKTLRVKQQGLCSAIFMVSYDKLLNKSTETFVMGNKSGRYLNDLSPILIKEHSHYELLTISYDIDYSFSRKFRKLLGLFLPNTHKKKLQKEHTNGIMSHVSQELPSSFTYKKLIPFENIGERRPWHFDMISYNDKKMLLIYDLNNDKEIYISYWNKDTYTIKEYPILQNIQRYAGIYKPTGVVFNDELLLFHTACTSSVDTYKHELWISIVDLTKIQ